MLLQQELELRLRLCVGMWCGAREVSVSVAVEGHGVYGHGLDTGPGQQRNNNILLALRSRWQRALGSRLKRDPDAGMYGFIKKTVR